MATDLSSSSQSTDIITIADDTRTGWLLLQLMATGLSMQGSIEKEGTNGKKS